MRNANGDAEPYSKRSPSGNEEERTCPTSSVGGGGGFVAMHALRCGGGCRARMGSGHRRDGEGESSVGRLRKSLGLCSSVLRLSAPSIPVPQLSRTGLADRKGPGQSFPRQKVPRAVGPSPLPPCQAAPTSAPSRANTPRPWRLRYNIDGKALSTAADATPRAFALGLS